MYSTRTRSRGSPRNVANAVAQAVRLHVVRVDRELIARGIGERVRGADRGVPLERDFVLGLEHPLGGGQRRTRVAVTSGAELDVGCARRM